MKFTKILLAMLPADARSATIDRTAVVRPQGFAPRTKFQVPNPVMIYEYRHLPMQQVPTDVIIIRRGTGSVDLNGQISATTRITIPARWMVPLATPALLHLRSHSRPPLPSG